MPRHQRSLVVGKFSPLHLGHEALLDRAHQDSSELVIISYANPERRGCEAAVRRRWLSVRFPRARVLVVDDTTLKRLDGAPALPSDDAPDCEHRRFVGFLCLSVLEVEVDAVYSSEDYGPGFAQELERYFAEHGRRRSVVHVSFDRERVAVPTSASAIYRDPHAERRYLSANVYADFLERVALLGGESSGKSTLSAALAAHFATAFVPEYGRTLWETKRGQLEFDDLLDIGRRQVELEEAAAKTAHRYVFCDTTPLITKLYSEVLFGRTDPALEELARRPYAVTLVCAPDFDFQQDGTRRDAAFRASQHETILRTLEAQGSPYSVVRGSVEERVHQVEQILGARR